MCVCVCVCVCVTVRTHAGVVSLQCFQRRGLQTLVCRGKAGECSGCLGHRGTPQQRCRSMQQGPVSVDNIMETEDLVIYRLQEIHLVWGKRGNDFE